MDTTTASISYIDTLSRLSQSELETLNTRIATNADKWLGKMVQQNKDSSRIKEPVQLKSTRGRKPKAAINPFYGIIGVTTYWGRYPVFALDIIEGVARLDWHDRPTEVGGKSMPLSVRDLAVILESLPIVTTEAVQELLRLGERHARRYVKAIELIIPWMIKSRPRSIINEMEGVEPELQVSDWEDCNEPITPSPEELAKLHHDLRTLTQYKTAEEYEAELEYKAPTTNIIAFPTRKQHPKKGQVLRMLMDGMLVKPIERETGVSANTIRKWRDEMHAAQGKFQAA